MNNNLEGIASVQYWYYLVGNLAANKEESRKGTRMRMETLLRNGILFICAGILPVAVRRIVFLEGKKASNIGIVPISPAEAPERLNPSLGVPLAVYVARRIIKGQNLRDAESVDVLANLQPYA